GIIDRQVSQLTRLVDDLLDVGRITSGKIALQKEAVEVNATVLRAVEVCRPLADARGHALEVLLAHEPLSIEGDPVRLSQTVVKQLVHMHGGSVVAQSSGPGMGSELVVRLPILTQRPSTSGPVSRQEPPLSRPRRRVLIVDDNHDSADSSQQSCAHSTTTCG